ncbi:AAA family ATPase [Embleya sp. NPDC008237]|uniref:AAA family ATPase n=1 Tax=Embleya sp. NPDC008237 TaxID=3363978 RepID=UPI0036E44A0B
MSTRQLGQVAEALTHTVAAHGIMGVYGDTGHGKTIAVHQALRLLPRRIPVDRAQVAVKPALPQLRAALLTAFGLPTTHLTNRTDAADRVLIDALKEPGVLIVDDAGASPLPNWTTYASWSTPPPLGPRWCCVEPAPSAPSPGLPHWPPAS